MDSAVPEVGGFATVDCNGAILPYFDSRSAMPRRVKSALVQSREIISIASNSSRLISIGVNFIFEFAIVFLCSIHKSAAAVPQLRNYLSLR